MLVVSDTTPIISFVKMGKLEILGKLFGEVVLPFAVYNELTSNETFATEATIINACKFFKVVKIENDEYVSLLRRATGLDLGESEAIVYSDTNKADLLIVDEVKARKVATSMNLKITGTIGLLTVANRTGLLNKEEAIQCVELLRKNHRHISEAILNSFVNSLK